MMTEQKQLILMIEDEAHIRHFVRATLQDHGYRVIEATTGTQGLEQAARQQPALILLDLGLPDIDGLQVTQQLRAWTDVPIVVLSARGQEQDKIAALDDGADDYLTKPFGVGELLARIRVALRHAARAVQEHSDPMFSVGNMRVDLMRRQVFVDDEEVHLTPIEYKMLTTLIQHAGKVVTHNQLLKAVWGPAYATETPYLRVYMGQLRHKLEADATRPRYLITEPGVGYRLRAE
jgi:two-component system KDP operon response regulator KdpE